MARNFPKSGLSLTILFFILFSVNISVDGKPKTFSKSLNPATFGLKKEKLTHFRVYWHDIFSGTKPTVVQVAAGQSTNTSSTLFGALMVIDDPLTEGPELSSKLVGRSQGFYASASQNEVGLIMAMNFAFMEGKYNGSTITILGRNTVFSKVREMPVIGGSGLFRFARGYAQAKTYKFDPTKGDATVEYNIYVLHY